MNNMLKAVLTGAALVSLAVSAFAQMEPAARPKSDDNRPRATLNREAASSASPEAGPAKADFARMAALIRRDLVIERNKNVDSVRRLSEGVYCVKPVGGLGINPSNSIAIVTPEFHFSLYNEVGAQWRQQGSGCASNEFAVVTTANLNLNYGRYVRSNAVSFAIVVP